MGNMFPILGKIAATGKIMISTRGKYASTTGRIVFSGKLMCSDKSNHVSATFTRCFEWSFHSDFSLTL